MMKKWMSALLAAVLSLTLIGCSVTEVAEVAGVVLEAALEQQVQEEPSAESDAAEESGGEAELPVEEAEPEQDEEDLSQQPEEVIPEQSGEQTEPGQVEEEPQAPEATLPEDGVYTSKEDVALYLHLYGHLPDNFITKKEAEKLGWPGGSLEPYAPGMCIGGSRFGNYERLLPEAKGRTYTECDIDTLGADKRGAKRIVFSNDGLIYYTDDHYESFELLYGEE